MPDLLKASLHAAMDHFVPSDRIAALKRAVAEEIERTDPGVRVLTTDYFNHSFVPDMIIDWKRESRSRQLFLRSNGDPRWLLDDLSLIADESPMMFSLAGLPSESAEPLINGLNEVAKESGTWITDSEGLTDVNAERSNAPSARLLGQALFRGGRGVFDHERVRGLVEATGEGFSGAESGDVEATRTAVLAIEDQLNAEQGSRLTRVLRAVWEGNGGSGAEFPSSDSIGMLTPQDLEYLLTTLQEESHEFWARVGGSVGTATIGSLDLPTPSATFQVFVQANLPHLTAKGIQVQERELLLGEDESSTFWAVDSGCLALRGSGWIAHIAADLREELPQSPPMPDPTLLQLQDRSNGSAATVVGVEFSHEGRFLSYESRGKEDILADVQLQDVFSGVAAEYIQRASAVLPSGVLLTLHLPQGLGVAQTRSKAKLEELVSDGIPLLWPLGESRLAEIRGLLAAAVPDALGKPQLRITSDKHTLFEELDSADFTDGPS